MSISDAASDFIPHAPLAIIAGSGDLPQHIIAHRNMLGYDSFVIAIHGFTDAQIVEEIDHVWCRIGAVGDALSAMKARGIHQMVMAGTVTRPSLKGLYPDAKGRILLKRLGGALFAGDDKLLRTVITFFEDEGVYVYGAHEVYDGLLAPAGVMTSTSPSSDMAVWYKHGSDILRVLSPYDVGQAIIIYEGHVLGIEAAEGTAALIERCAALRDGNAGGILVKQCKTGQHTRADMPTVGVDTIRALTKHAFDGLYVGADSTLMLDKTRMVNIANDAGLFIEGIVKS